MAETTRTTGRIGSALLKAALEFCRDKSPRGKIQLHSSTHATPFHIATGFHQTALGIKRPGGCIPLEHDFTLIP